MLPIRWTQAGVRDTFRFWDCAELISDRIAAAFHRLLGGTDRWLEVEHRTGPDDVAAVYHELLEGKANPASGYVVSMSPGALFGPWRGS